MAPEVIVEQVSAKANWKRKKASVATPGRSVGIGNVVAGSSTGCRCSPCMPSPCAEHPGKAPGPEEDAAEAGIHEAFQQHVHRFPGAREAALQEHEARLHEEHQEGGDQHPHGVDRVDVRRVGRRSRRAAGAGLRAPACGRIRRGVRRGRRGSRGGGGGSRRGRPRRRRGRGRILRANFGRSAKEKEIPEHDQETQPDAEHFPSKYRQEQLALTRVLHSFEKQLKLLHRLSNSLLI